MAVRHETRACNFDADPVVEPAPPGPVCLLARRLMLAAVYGLWAFAIVSFAVGTLNLLLGGVTPWPISQAGQ
jgi:hypothetical protein